MIIVSIEADGLPARRVVVHRLPCRIGRRKDNEIVLDSWRVARVHARIDRMERGCRLVDGGALSGTWVNGERIVEFGPLDAARSAPSPPRSTARECPRERRGRAALGGEVKRSRKRP